MKELSLFLISIFFMLIGAGISYLIRMMIKKLLKRENSKGKKEKWNRIDEQWKLERRLSIIELDILSIKKQVMPSENQEQQQKQPLPKRKVTKTVRGWVNVWDDHVSKVYPDKAQANKDYGYLNSTAAARIACVEVTGTYEVEE